LTMSVSTTPGGEIRWINPAGGDFNVTTNWDPQLVPAFSDTAVFDLTGGVPVTILAMNNAVARWIIRHMTVHLAGSAQVLGTAADEFKFVVDDGGTLLLDDGATFSTNDAVVGNLAGNAESSVFVRGPQTKWTVAAPGALVIGFRTLGGVIVNH